MASYVLTCRKNPNKQNHRICKLNQSLSVLKDSIEFPHWQKIQQQQQLNNNKKKRMKYANTAKA
jgi:hypothetical protein